MAEQAEGMSDELQPILVSHQTLRRVVGVLGMSLPPVLIAGCYVLGAPVVIQDSISDYYGTEMRNVLVGILFTVGWSLFCYRGYQKRDDRAGDVACFSMLCVALFPVTSPSAWVRHVHVASAALLFLTLAYFSICLFTKTDQPDPTREKKRRNQIYVACGVVMIGCIVAIGIFWAFLQQTPVADLKPVLVFEWLALWAFGISWFVKGETVFRDKP